MTASSQARRALPETAAAACLGVLLLGYLAHSWLFVGQLNDDAFITFRYSRNLAHGIGPYFNQGEHVEGYTNFLLMALLAPAVAAGGEAAALPAAKVLGLLCGAAALVMAYFIARELVPENRGGAHGQAAGLLAAAICAANPGFAQNSSTGLETTLFAALLGAGCWLGLRTVRERRWRGAGLAFGAALLTRPDGALAFGAFYLATLAATLAPAPGEVHAAGEEAPAASPWMLRAPLAVDALITAGIFLIHLVFRLLAYDGEWLPNTYFAKSGGFWKITPAAYVQGGMLTPLLGPGGVLAAVAGLLLARPQWGRLLATASIPLAGMASVVAVGTDWMPGYRLLVPYFPLAAVVTAVGWLGLAGTLTRWRTRAAAAVTALLVPVVFLAQTETRRTLEKEIRTRIEGYTTGHLALASWLRRNADPRASVALMDIGMVGYFSPEARVIDLSGLTDRHIAKSPGLFLHKEYDPAYIFSLRPDFIVLTLWAPDDPARPPTPDTAWMSWTDAEHSLAQAREFSRYVGEGPAPLPGDWKNHLAGRIGAVMVFEHRHQGTRYVLALFRRQDA